MSEIDKTFLETIKGDKKNRNKQAHSTNKLIKQGRKLFLSLYYFTKNLKSGEYSSMLLSLDSWRSSKGKMSTETYKPRDIVMADLGLGHGYEISYQHPCIVVSESKGFCFVVPCSTGKYQKRSKYILNGEPKHGFQEPTGVLLDAVQCIQKVRIQHKVGVLDLGLFKVINEKLLKFYLSKYDHQINVLQKDLAKEKEKNAELEKKLEEMGVS